MSNQLDADQLYEQEVRNWYAYHQGFHNNLPQIVVEQLDAKFSGLSCWPEFEAFLARFFDDNFDGIAGDYEWARANSRSDSYFCEH